MLDHQDIALLQGMFSKQEIKLEKHGRIFSRINTLIFDINVSVSEILRENIFPQITNLHGDVFHIKQEVGMA